MKRVLVLSSSFLDTPGPHHQQLEKAGVSISRIRGPLKEGELLSLFSAEPPFDGIICGEDEFTAAVLEAIKGRTRIISKYGVGLDRIDVERAAQLGIRVSNTPGVNHTTVAELAFGLLLGLVRRIPEHNTSVQRGEWRRSTGTELAGKTLGIIGLGRVGREMVKRALAFEMQVLVYNTNWNASHSGFVEAMAKIFSHETFSEFHPRIERIETPDELLAQSDFISLHMNLTRENRYFLNRSRLQLCRRGAFIVNVSRGSLVDEQAMAEALQRGQIAGYAADVLETEPVSRDNPLLGLSNVVLTPHIGSRTYDSVARQGCFAVKNVLEVIGIES